MSELQGRIARADCGIPYGWPSGVDLFQVRELGAVVAWLMGWDGGWGGFGEGGEGKGRKGKTSPVPSLFSHPISPARFASFGIFRPMVFFLGEDGGKRRGRE